MSASSNIPDIVLVKKKFSRTKSRRIWKLKHLDKDVDMKEEKETNLKKKEKEYEEFLCDIEENKDIREKVNLYKDEAAIEELASQMNKMNVNSKDDDSEIDIKLDDLLSEMTLNDKTETIEETEESIEQKNIPNRQLIGKRVRSNKDNSENN